MSSARIWGVDFSGAKDAEKRLWIVEARLEGAELRIERLQPVIAYDANIRGPAAAARALAQYAATAKPRAVGVDAPFGLARESVAAGAPDAVDWRGLLEAVADCGDAEAFRSRFGAREARRVTDKAAKTPFAPTNLRLYRQTFHAMAHFAWPLVRNDQARFPPMQAGGGDRPLVFETCPASLLKRAALYAPYKGRGEEHRKARAALWAGLQSWGVHADGPTAVLMIDDPGGDAIDAVLCAFMAAKAWRAHDPARSAEPGSVEAEVFVPAPGPI